MEQENSEELNLQANDPQSKQLIGMLGHPLRLLRNSGKEGLRALRNFFIMLVLFVLSNMIFFALGLYSYFTGDAETGAIGWVFVLVLIGIVCTALAAYRGYQYLIIEMMHQIYRTMDGVMRKLCNSIIDKVRVLLNNSHEVGQEKFEQQINLTVIVRERYRSSPRLFRKGLIMMLSRIPLFPFVQELHDEIEAGDRAASSKKLHLKLDGFIEEKIFGTNSNQMMLIILLINVLGSLLIITYKLG